MPIIVEMPREKADEFLKRSFSDFSTQNTKIIPKSILCCVYVHFPGEKSKTVKEKIRATLQPAKLSA